ncbi:Uncharacterized protein FKW44_000056 [Caligus rogercresseyi]|uniref:Uncharacterized protein n=1 Tax=Caligus rogercresseyi TaxID=217165 RepID=A0A7T8KGT7_CALRO|nr:Uncharacterized protein FKW44_000056 [Caligus rogercresseyi]
MSLGFVASTGIAAPPLIWFPTVFRLKAADYIKVLKTKFLTRKHVEFWPKDMWPPYSPDANPLDYASWPQVQSKACTLRHANVEAMKASVNEHWTSMFKE